MRRTLAIARHAARCGRCALLGARRRRAAQSAPNCPTMRKINVGVSVAPPNVVHTSPYVAKALGFFAKRCIDANIIQFEGGQSQTANVAAAQGSAIISVSDVAIGRGMKVQQIWGLAPRMPQAYMVPEGIKTAADLKGKRLSATGGGVGGFNWRMGREVLQDRPASTSSDAQFISVADRRPAARPDRRPDRRRGAASGGRVPRQEAEADAQRAGPARRPDAQLHVQRLRRLDRLDRARPRAAARHRRRDDRGQPHDLSREGQGRADHHGGDPEAEGGGRIRDRRR